MVRGADREAVDLALAASREAAMALDSETRRTSSRRFTAGPMAGGDEEVKKGHRKEEREWPKGRGGDGGVARHRRQGDGGEDAR